MPDTSHEIPTHLQVEDKPLLGLSARQLAYLLAGASAAYALWQQGAGLPPGPRAALAAACLLVAATVALLRPLGAGAGRVGRGRAPRRGRPPPEPLAAAGARPAGPGAGRGGVGRVRPAPGVAGAARLAATAGVAGTRRAGRPPGPGTPPGHPGRPLGRAGSGGGARPSRRGGGAVRPPASAQTVHVGLEAITGDAVRLAGGRWRAVLRVGGLQLWLRDAGDQEAVLVAFAAFLNGLAFPVQLLVRVLPFDGDPYLERLERAGHGGPESLAALARDHAAFFRRLAREGAFLERRFYLVVPAPVAGPGRAGAAPRRRRWCAAAGLAARLAARLAVRPAGRPGRATGRHRRGRVRRAGRAPPPGRPVRRGGARPRALRPDGVASGRRRAARAVLRLLVSRARPRAAPADRARRPRGPGGGRPGRPAAGGGPSPAHAGRTPRRRPRDPVRVARARLPFARTRPAAGPPRKRRGHRTRTASPWGRAASPTPSRRGPPRSPATTCASTASTPAPWW